MVSCQTNYNKTDTTKLNQYINSLYQDIVQSYKYTDKLSIELKKIELSLSSYSNSVQYFSDTILVYIRSNIRETYSYCTKINGKYITLNFSICESSYYDQNQLNLYSKLVFMIIYILSKQASKTCAKNITIQIFLTHFKKILPQEQTAILGTNEVNSGYSTAGCQQNTQITIYREEEWYKVLIHELFHNLNLDFSTMDISKIQRKLASIFQINSLYEIYETYCETWARILNVAITSFTFSLDNKQKFRAKFHELIQYERIFSLQQGDIILNRIKNTKNYRENSNVFCYYILTGAIMNNYFEFLKWCDINNTKLFRFKNTIKNLESFVEFILTEINSQNFKDMLICARKLERYINNSLRMTIVNAV